MLSTYIKNLLDVHSRVIVPDLGAFMLKGDASKTIYFNEFLRFNDGLLVDHIAEQEHIDKIEAAKKVKAFVDNTNKQLSGSKSVALEGIGTLYLDINEKIQLKTSEEAPAAPTVKQTEAETSPHEILFELEKTEPEPAPQGQVSTPPPAAPAAPENKPKPEAPPQKVKAVKSEPSEPVSPPVKETKENTTTKEETVEASPTTTKRMIFVGIFGVIVIGAIAYFAFFRSPKKDSNVNQNITVGINANKDTTVTAKDTAGKATVKAAANKPQPKATVASNKKEDTKTPAPAKTAENKAKTVSAPVAKSETPKAAASSTSGKKFYVIAGTFSVEANADRMVKKLKDEGYAPNKIKNDARNVFYVSYSSFSDKASAQEEMKKLKSSGKADSWIYTN